MGRGVGTVGSTCWRGQRRRRSWRGQRRRNCRRRSWRGQRRRNCRQHLLAWAEAAEKLAWAEAAEKLVWADASKLSAALAGVGRGGGEAGVGRGGGTVGGEAGVGRGVGEAGVGRGVELSAEKLAWAEAAWAEASELSAALAGVVRGGGEAGVGRGVGTVGSTCWRGQRRRRSWRGQRRRNCRQHFLFMKDTVLVEEKRIVPVLLVLASVVSHLPPAMSFLLCLLPFLAGATTSPIPCPNSRT